jgi:hypothetical protein
MIQKLTSRLPPGPIVPTLRMNVLYADALLAPDELIEQRIRGALDRDVGSWPFERSRMQLMLGSRLRRRRQIQEARELLRAARDGFDSLGALPWAERARDELRAAGVPSRAPAPMVWSSLSAQELQVARILLWSSPYAGMPMGDAFLPRKPGLTFARKRRRHRFDCDATHSPGTFIPHSPCSLCPQYGAY